MSITLLRSTPRRSTPRRSTPRRLAKAALLVLSLLLVSPSGLRAQFNGPTSLGTTEINRPITLTTDPAILYPSIQDVVLTTGDQVSIRPLRRS